MLGMLCSPGAALGRLYGKVTAWAFPDGFVSEGVRIRIMPAGYAPAGTAAYWGAATQTISTALLTFELAGQMSHILPVPVAMLVANAISQSSRPPFFDGIILTKRLPFLPKLSADRQRPRHLCGELHGTDLQYLSQENTRKDLQRLLRASRPEQFPR